VIVIEDENERDDLELHPYCGKRTRHSMSETHAAAEDPDETGRYEIRIKGHLDARMAARFEGLTLTLEDTGDTLLTGPVVDQAALHGLLRKVRDLAMPLVAVTRVRPGQVAASEGKHRVEASCLERRLGEESGP
jgi:hypothetical protein